MLVLQFKSKIFLHNTCRRFVAGFEARTLICFSLQIYPEGIRHIRQDKRVNEWKSPGKKTIVRCAVNRRQVVIALTGGELVYFEMDPVSLLSSVIATFYEVGVLKVKFSPTVSLTTEKSFLNLIKYLKRPF